MSERTIKACGVLLALISVLLIMWPLLEFHMNGRSYPCEKSRTWIPEPIDTEKNGTVMINEADTDALTTLPGIGPAYAERIIQDRKENGPFHYPEDLVAVRGIGPLTLSGFRTMIDMTRLDESGE